jgi:hypothetical protein
MGMQQELLNLVNHNQSQVSRQSKVKQMGTINETPLYDSV